MSLDNVSHFRLGSSQSMITHLVGQSAFLNTAANYQQIDTDWTDIDDSKLVTQWNETKGWDMPMVELKTRHTAEGQGELPTSYKMKGRRLSMQVSETVDDSTATDNLVKIMDPSNRGILGVYYDNSKTTRYLIRTHYTRGFDRAQRNPHGRSKYGVTLFSPWGYFVEPKFAQLHGMVGSPSVTPEGQGPCVWGVRITGTSGITRLQVAKDGATPWVWHWTPPFSGVSPPPTALGSNAPTEVLVCFSSPFHGVWGKRGAAEDDVSPGRIYGFPQDNYLKSGETSQIVINGTGITSERWWYLKNYPRI